MVSMWPTPNNGLRPTRISINVIRKVESYAVVCGRVIASVKCLPGASKSDYVLTAMFKVSRTLCAKALGVNGFSMKAVPSSNTPW